MLCANASTLLQLSNDLTMHLAIHVVEDQECETADDAQCTGNPRHGHVQSVQNGRVLGLVGNVAQRTKPSDQDSGTDSTAGLQHQGDEGSQDLGADEIIKKWWHYMADIMETNEDESPVSEPLKEVFYME